MPASSPEFRCLHALRIKGFADADAVAQVVGLALDEVARHLDAFRARGLAEFREARSLWRLTGAGRTEHREALRIDSPDSVRQLLAPSYRQFLPLNVEFKDLCGDWQLVGGDPTRLNDHSDAAYDAGVLARLLDLDQRVRPVLGRFGDVHARLAPYVGRLDHSFGRLRSGESAMFTGVRCNSYHDVWMELHEDLILTLGIDRDAEGSY